MRFRNYVNRHNRRNRIFSDEDLLKMTLEAIFDNEPSIIAQNEAIGIPSYDELAQSQNTEWIEPFKNEQGFDDGGYWQSVLTPDYQETFTGLKKPQIQHGIAGNVQINNSQNNWDDVKFDDLDAYLDKDLINNMPETVLEGKVEKSYTPLDKVKDNIQESMDKLKTKVEDTQKKYEGLSPIVAAQKAASKGFGDKLVENEYYRNSLKMKDGEPLTDEFLKENDIYGLKDITDPEKSNYYKEQLAKMYGLDLNDPDIDEKLKDKKIVVPKENSRLYQYAKNSEAMEKWIVDNYDRIKNGEKPLNDTIEFPLGGLKGAFNDKQRGLFATIHRANMNDIKINSDGSITGRIDDPYNYEEWDKIKGGINFSQNLKNFVFNRYVDINNNAQKQQDVNQLEQFLTSMPIHFTKEEIEEILKRKYKKL